MDERTEEHVVTIADVGDNIEILGWGETLTEAVEHAIEVLNRAGHDREDLTEDCRTWPASTDLIAALDEDKDAPWFITDGVFGLDYSVLAEREASAEAA